MKEFSKYFDHTLLKPDASEKDAINLFKEALKYDFYGVCVDSCWLPLACRYLKDSSVSIVTVIGFPLGTSSTGAKAAEAKEALSGGADEIDAVINVGALKDGRYDYVTAELAALADICHESGAAFKIILETCLLTDDEIVTACRLAEKAGVDFVKTSTGFSTGGATKEAVSLIRKTVGNRMHVKASGGIRTLTDALAMIDAGANRLGCSASAAIMEEYEKSELSMPITEL